MNCIDVSRGPLSTLATAVVVLWLPLPAAAAPPAPPAPSSTATLAIGNRDWPGWAIP